MPIPIPGAAGRHTERRPVGPSVAGGLPPAPNPYDPVDDDTFRQVPESTDGSPDPEDAFPDLEDDWAPEPTPTVSSPPMSSHASDGRRGDTGTYSDSTDSADGDTDDDGNLSGDDVPPSDALDVDRPEGRHGRTATPTAAHRSGRSGRPKKKTGHAAAQTAGGTEQTDADKGVFIDRKKHTLLPFGRRSLDKSASTRDRRQDMKKSRRRVEVAVWVVLAILVGLAAKNTFIPPKTLSVSQVQNIAAQVSGTGAFPLEAGRGMSIDYMKAFLTPNDQTSQTVLTYFTTGGLPTTTMGAGSAVDGVTVRPDQSMKNTILYGPTVYAAKGVTSYSATYTVGALVNAASTKDPGSSTTQWQFFEVNLFYNSSTGAYSIAPGSPSAVPTPIVASATSIPPAETLGTGQESQELDTTLQSVVWGFLDAYRTSSPANHTALNQYIASQDPALIQGMNNTYTFVGGKQSAITYQAYPTQDADVAKVLVTVQWGLQASTGQSAAQSVFTSTYVMTVNKAGSTWLVSKFAPQIYVKSSSS